jgi:hypothetical protein
VAFGDVGEFDLRMIVVRSRKLFALHVVPQERGWLLSDQLLEGWSENTWPMHEAKIKKVSVFVNLSEAV